MEQKKEAVYLINDERYLHLRENGAGVGFATYNKVTGEQLESGQISEKNLPPDGKNAIAAARNWYLFELSDDERKVIQLESVKILESVPASGIHKRRIWEPETMPKDPDALVTLHAFADGSENRKRPALELLFQSTGLEHPDVDDRCLWIGTGIEHPGRHRLSVRHLWILLLCRLFSVFPRGSNGTAV